MHFSITADTFFDLDRCIFQLWYMYFFDFDRGILRIGQMLFFNKNFRLKNDSISVDYLSNIFKQYLPVSLSGNLTSYTLNHSMNHFCKSYIFFYFLHLSIFFFFLLFINLWRKYYLYHVVFRIQINKQEYANFELFYKKPLSYDFAKSLN